MWTVQTGHLLCPNIVQPVSAEESRNQTNSEVAYLGCGRRKKSTASLKPLSLATPATQYISGGKWQVTAARADFCVSFSTLASMRRYSVNPVPKCLLLMFLGWMGLKYYQVNAAQLREYRIAAQLNDWDYNLQPEGLSR